jgi:hypothetical protein
MAPDRDTLLVLLEAGNDFDFFFSKLQALSVDPLLGATETWIACAPGQATALAGRLPAPFKHLPFLEAVHLSDLRERIKKPFVAFLPAAAPFFPPAWPVQAPPRDLVHPWIPPHGLPDRNRGYIGLPPCGWMAPRPFLENLEGSSFPALLDLERLQQEKGFGLHYASTPVASPLPAEYSLPVAQDPPLNSSSRVLALVPHFNCVKWLGQCLDTLVSQTRPLEGIVVIDDVSTEDPLPVVSRFPQATLLRSRENVGPYRLVQSVIDATGYDAYLFQDADDWSAVDRLELLLREAEATGAGLVGAQELMHLKEKIYLNPHPRDVNRAFSLGWGHSLLHPSSLLSKDLNRRLGGYSAGLRFGGDLEFQSRAVWAGRVLNLPYHGYFRRIRENSLITAPATGIGSPARKLVDQKTRDQFNENARLVSENKVPHLEPHSPAGPVAFEHLAGPLLRPLEK